MSNESTHYAPLHSIISSSTSNKSANQIPLPTTPSPVPAHKPLRKSSSSFRTLDTVDSFEILEQTIMKQKRLGRNKNTDMRMKILLKRTFNLVCEMMDKENGFDSLDNVQEEIVPVDNNTQDMEETLIINLSETESLDLAFQTSEELNYIDLENFNYENLLSEGNDTGLIDKNKSFLTTGFFGGSDEVCGEEEEDTDTTYRYKRRRSSGDDDNEVEQDKSYYLFNDLTNTSSCNKKKRCMSGGEESIGVKKFKESSSNSINIVT